MNVQLILPKSNPFDLDIPQTRLPPHIEFVRGLHCQFELVEREGFTVLILKTQGQASIWCQRCMKPFIYDYQNETQLALCDSDQKAEELMDLYEPVVLQSKHIPFEDIIADELILYLPSFHLEQNACVVDFTE